MAAARFLNMVYTECSPELEAKFNRWYNEVHIPLLFKYPGLKKVTRYERLGDNKEQARYLAVYEYDTREDLERFPDSVEFKEATDEMQGNTFHHVFDGRKGSKWSPGSMCRPERLEMDGPVDKPPFAQFPRAPC